MNMNKFTFIFVFTANSYQNSPDFSRFRSNERVLDLVGGFGVAYDDFVVI